MTAPAAALATSNKETGIQPDDEVNDIPILA
jgi:hypothetical protein